MHRASVTIGQELGHNQEFKAADNFLCINSRNICRFFGNKFSVGENVNATFSTLCIFFFYLKAFNGP